MSTGLLLQVAVPLLSKYKSHLAWYVVNSKAVESGPIFWFSYLKLSSLLNRLNEVKAANVINLDSAIGRIRPSNCNNRAIFCLFVLSRVHFSIRITEYCYLGLEFMIKFFWHAFDSWVAAVFRTFLKLRNESGSFVNVLYVFKKGFFFAHWHRLIRPDFRGVCISSKLTEQIIETGDLTTSSLSILLT